MVIKVKRGPLSGLAGSGTIDGEMKFIKDTNDLYVYNDTAPAGNRNLTSPPVVGGSIPLEVGAKATIADINLYRFYSIYCTIDGTYNTTPIRLTREMISSGTKVYPVWYYSGTILTFNLTFTDANSTSVKVQHNLTGETITIHIYKEK